MSRWIQKCLNYKTWRDQNRWHPSTARTPGQNLLKLFAEVPQEDTFRGIRGIFEFHPRSQDNELFVAHFRVLLDPPKGSKMSTTVPIFQLLRRNSKIPPMPLKVSSCGASTKKLRQFGLGVWAVGGGAIDFGPSTSYNSGTSVLSRIDTKRNLFLNRLYPGK